MSRKKILIQSEVGEAVAEAVVEAEEEAEAEESPETTRDQRPRAIMADHVEIDVMRLRTLQKILTTTSSTLAHIQITIESR